MFNSLQLSLEEVNAGQQYYKIPTLAITLAMDRKPSHCELTSVLISDLCGSILTTEDIVIGFTVLLNDLPDLVLDTPDAPNVIICCRLSCQHVVFVMTDCDNYAL